MIENKADLIRSVYHSHFKRNSLLGIISGSAFLAWGGFDYLIGEPLAFLFLAARVFIFAICATFFLFRNTAWHFQYHISINVFLISPILGCLCLFSAHSKFPVAYFGGLSFVMLAYTVMQVARPRTLVIPVTVILLGTLYNWEWISELSPFLTYSLVFYLLSSLFFAVFGLHLIFDQALTNEKNKFKLNDSRIHLGNISEERKKLLRVLTHDLSNSLILIQTSVSRAKKFIKTFGEPSENSEVKKILEAVQRLEKASEFQQEVIEHVRLNEGLKDGKISIQLEKVSFRKILERAKFLFRDKIEDKNIQLNIECVEEDHFFLADEVAFSTHVFNNLISNAIKFSYPDSTINVRCYNVNDAWVIVEVEDNGIGIDPSTKNVLFESDKRTSRLGTMGEEGTGFGMPLMKTYVDLFNGEVEVHSQSKEEYPNDHGTTFILRLKSYTKEASLAS